MEYHTLMISPSKLETYRKFKDEEWNGFITEEAVITDIKGEKEWSAKMTFGTAFHAVLEHGHERYLQDDGLYHIKVDDMPEEIICTFEELIPAIEHRIAHPYMVHEIKAKHWLKIKGYNVLLNMRVDGAEGLRVHEHKTTSKPVELEGYERSIQWRIYLLATKAQYVQYNIFKVYEPKKGPRRVDPFSFKLFPYEGLERDVCALVHSFIEFCEKRNLLPYIKSMY